MTSRDRPTLAAAAFLTAVAVGGAAPASAQDDAESVYDRIWGLATLYEGDSDSFIQSFALKGRVQLDFAWVDSGVEDHVEFNVRRLRFGFRTVFLRSFTLHAEAEFDPHGDDFYSRLTDSYLAWSPSPAAEIRVGKHSAGFTLDGMTSSNELLTIDRSNLTNNIWFTYEYMPGASISGEASGLVYRLGVYSSGDETPEFGDFTGGAFVLLTVGHDFADLLAADEGLLRLNVVHNEPDPDNGFTNMLEWIGSLNVSYASRGAWGVRADVSAGQGYGDQSDLWGFYAMPFLDLTGALQLVTRYTYIDSEDANGVRFARYEREIVEGLGDRYEEIYAGLNIYLYGHKLKLQNGIQWVDMNDRADDGGAYDGWGWTTAVRISW